MAKTKNQYNQVPHNQEPYRQISPALFEEVYEHLKDMLDAGAIRESESPFSSNMVLVHKKMVLLYSVTTLVSWMAEL